MSRESYVENMSFIHFERAARGLSLLRPVIDHTLSEEPREMFPRSRGLWHTPSGTEFRFQTKPKRVLSCLCPATGARWQGPVCARALNGLDSATLGIILTLTLTSSAPRLEVY